MSVHPILSRLRRRSFASFVIAAGLVTLLALLNLSVPGELSAAAPNSSDLVGSWRSKLQFDKGILAPVTDLEFMYAFNAGGTLSESSNHDANPPVPPAYGIWQKTGPKEFQAKYEFYITEAPKELAVILSGGGWKPATRGVFVETMKLSADGKNYTSKIHFEIFDNAGKLVEGGGDATASGQKLTF